jgi:hypothetical protein
MQALYRKVGMMKMVNEIKSIIKKGRNAFLIKGFAKFLVWPRKFGRETFS